MSGQRLSCFSHAVRTSDGLEFQQAFTYPRGVNADHRAGEPGSKVRSNPTCR